MGARRPISTNPDEAGTIDDRSTVADAPSSAVSSLSSSKRNMARTSEVGRPEQARQPVARLGRRRQTNIHMNEI
jgi:hypothetical protein